LCSISNKSGNNSTTNVDSTNDKIESTNTDKKDKFFTSKNENSNENNIHPDPNNSKLNQNTKLDQNSKLNKDLNKHSN